MLGGYGTSSFTTVQFEPPLVVVALPLYWFLRRPVRDETVFFYDKPPLLNGLAVLPFLVLNGCGKLPTMFEEDWRSEP